MAINILVTAFILALFMGSTPVWATDTAFTPKQIVKNLYQPYLADPRAEKVGELAALDLILPYASKALQSAIRRDEECKRREQGICNIDFDIIINAQDWNLSNFALQEGYVNTLPVISATFSNGGENTVSYFFIKEQGNWKIDEIEAVRYKENGNAEYRYKLKKELMGY